MTKVRTWAGLDVHAASAVACVIDAQSGELSVKRLAGKTSEVAAVCMRLPAPVRVAYEAGPTGFELARALEGAGVGCVVAAPGKIERPAQDRVKTDRRDAERRQNPPGTLHAREHPRFNYEQPPPRPRSILDSGLSRRNPVLRYPTRAYGLTKRRAPARPAAPPAEPPHHRRSSRSP